MTTTTPLPSKPPLPTPPAEVPVDRRLDVIAPKMRAAVERLCAQVEAETGVRPLIFECLRSDARQRFLWGFGREYNDGRGTVTHAMNADRTWHGFGLAVDVIHPSKRWNAPASYRAAVGRAARAAGLTWGGDWNGNGRSDDETLYDWPHVQWGRCRRSPSDRAVLLRAEGGLPAVWREVGAA